MSQYVEYVASKIGATIVILICVVIVLFAIPGWYNLSLQNAKSRDERNTTKYIFDDTGYDTSGTADVISMICAIITLLCAFGAAAVAIR